MIRIEVDRRVSKKIHALGPDAVKEAERRLSQLASEFGNPHAHSGLGVRKIGRKSYEIRVWLKWRIVFVHDGEKLDADDLLNHDGVRLWLKKRG